MALVQVITSAHPVQKAEDIERQVTELVQKTLGQAIRREQPIMEAGLDSLGAVELRSSLQTKLGIELPATLTFDYPTIASIAKYLATQISALNSGSGTSQVAALI